MSIFNIHFFSNKQHDHVVQPSTDVIIDHQAGKTLKHVFIDLPGVQQQGVDIDVLDNVLTVQGTFKPAKEGDCTYVTRERPQGKFSRTVQLPAGTKLGDITTSLVNGVLTITYPYVDDHFKVPVPLPIGGQGK